eukprot:4385060-Pleurochrysis_carterae.AAC.1
MVPAAEAGAAPGTAAASWPVALLPRVPSTVSGVACSHTPALRGGSCASDGASATARDATVAAAAVAAPAAAPAASPAAALAPCWSRALSLAEVARAEKSLSTSFAQSRKAAEAILCCATLVSNPMSLVKDVAAEMTAAPTAAARVDTRQSGASMRMMVMAVPSSRQPICTVDTCESLRELMRACASAIWPATAFSPCSGSGAVTAAKWSVPWMVMRSNCPAPPGSGRGSGGAESNTRPNAFTASFVFDGGGGARIGLSRTRCRGEEHVVIGEDEREERPTSLPALLGQLARDEPLEQVAEGRGSAALRGGRRACERERRRPIDDVGDAIARDGVVRWRAVVDDDQKLQLTREGRPALGALRVGRGEGGRVEQLFQHPARTESAQFEREGDGVSLGMEGVEVEGGGV